MIAMKAVSRVHGVILSWRGTAESHEAARAQIEAEILEHTGRSALVLVGIQGGKACCPPHPFAKPRRNPADTTDHS